MLKKILVRGFVGVLLLAILTIASFLIANIGDQKLRPEVESALNWQVPDQAFTDNGFLVLLGMGAKDDVDPAALGATKLRAEIARYEEAKKTGKEIANPTADPNEVEFENWDANRCDYKKQVNCVDFYLAQSLAVESQLFSSQSKLLQRYSAIKKNSRFIEVVIPDYAASLPSYRHLMNAAELERIQAIRKIGEGNIELGLNQILENAIFSRRFLGESKTLISHMIGVALVQRDIRVMSELLKRFPQLAADHERFLAVLQPASTYKISMREALMHERTAMMNIVQKTYLGADMHSAARPIVHLLFRPNAALNLSYDWCTLTASLADASSKEYEASVLKVERQQDSLLGFGIDPFYLQDPIAKALLNVSKSNFNSYIERHHDTQGYINLFALQLAIAAQGIKVENVTEYLQKNGAQFLDPSTEKPLQWDSVNQVLIFTGRQKSNQLLDQSNVFQIKI